MSCGHALPADARFCASCGTAQTQSNEPSHSAAEHRPPPSGVQRPSPPHRQQLSFELARLSRGELGVAAATLLLLITLFLPWFHVQVFDVSVPGVSLDALDAHGWMYLVLLLALATVGYLAGRAMSYEVHLPLTHRQALRTATGLALLLTVIAFLAEPTGTSRSYGAYIGLIAALCALACATRGIPDELAAPTGGPGAAAPPAPSPPPPSAPAPTPGAQTSAAVIDVDASTTTTSAAPPLPLPPPGIAVQPGVSQSASLDTAVSPAEPHTGTVECSCGHANPAHNRFCNACGAALASARS